MANSRQAKRSITARLTATSVAVLLTLVGCSSSGGGGDKVDQAEATTVTEDIGSASPGGVDEILDDGLEPPEADTGKNKPTVEDIEIVESGFDTYEGYDETKATVGVLVKNNSDKVVTNVVIVHALKDANGKPVSNQTTQIEAIEPGKTGITGTSNLSLTGTPTEYEVNVTRVDTHKDAFVIPITVEDIAPQQWGDGYDINGVVENTTDELVEHILPSCLLYRDGKVVGHAPAYTDSLVPGAVLAFDARAEVDIDDAVCHAGFFRW